MDLFGDFNPHEEPKDDEVGWLFADLNSYFASVEQQLNPKLRGRPVAVVPMLSDSTCCIAASYEAKAFGIKTGTMVGDAIKMCPGIVFVEVRHREYIEYHHKIIEAVESCLPVSSVMSIDEMACRLTGSDRQVPKAMELARQVKRAILKVGSQLTCSVGLAPNRFLSKTASDMQKPDGLVVIRKKDLPHILYPLKPRDLCGIGSRMEARLWQHQVKTVEQLLNLSIPQMRAVWGGVGGERFYKWLRGENLEVFHQEHQSVGHSHVLSPQLRNQKGAKAVGEKLIYKAGVRLRKIESWASAMALSVRYVDRSRFSTDVRMLECQDSLTLLEAFRLLWAEQRDLKAPLKVSITLFNLIHDTERTFNFFESAQRKNLTLAMDNINVKHGKNTIYFGSAHDIQMAAPTCIAFSSIPEL